MKRFLKTAFGLLSIAMGAAILIWCVYSVIVPNEHFRFSLIEVPRLLLPVALLWFGWSWLGGDSPKERQYAAELTVTLKLSDSKFGTEPERHAICALKHRLEDALEDENVAEIDGEEFGGGECSIFIHTDNPTKAKNAIQRFFSAEDSHLRYTIAQSKL